MVFFQRVTEILPLPASSLKSTGIIVIDSSRDSKDLAVVGGGGGFLQARVTVKPGEVLQVLVGGGGQSARGEQGGTGGFNGGGAGASRCDDPDALIRHTIMSWSGSRGVCFSAVDGGKTACLP